MDYKKLEKEIKSDNDMQKLIAHKKLEVNGYQKGKLINYLDWLIGGNSMSEGKFIPPFIVKSYTVSHKIGVMWIININ